MIIGTLLETFINGGLSAGLNGQTSVIFYTAQQAERWALKQSLNFVSGGVTYQALCMVVYTDTNTRRWWENGVERTA